MPTTTGLTDLRRSQQRVERLRPNLMDATRRPKPRAMPEREPLVDVVPLRRSRPSSCRRHDVTTLDAAGRFYARDAVELLGWTPGTVIWLRADGDRVFAMAAPGSVPPAMTFAAVIDERRRLRIAPQLCQWLGLPPGERLVVSTDPTT